MPTADQFLDEQAAKSADDFLDSKPNADDFHQKADDFLDAEPQGLMAGTANAIAQAAVKGTGHALEEAGAVWATMPITPQGYGIPGFAYVPADNPTQIEQQKRYALLGKPAELLKSIKDTGLYQAGHAIADVAPEVYPVSPENQKRFLPQAGEMAGGFIPLLASGPAAPLTIGLQSAGAHLDEDYELAKKEGLSDEEAAARTMNRSLGSGALQSTVFLALPKPLRMLGEKYLINKFGTTAVKEFIAGRVALGGEGAALGAASTAGENLVDDKPVLDNVGTGAVGMGAMNLFLPPYFSGKRPGGAADALEAELGSGGTAAPTAPLQLRAPPIITPPPRYNPDQPLSVTLNNAETLLRDAPPAEPPPAPAAEPAPVAPAAAEPAPAPAATGQPALVRATRTRQDDVPLSDLNGKMARWNGITGYVELDEFGRPVLWSNGKLYELPAHADASAASIGLEIYPHERKLQEPQSTPEPKLSAAPKPEPAGGTVAESQPPAAQPELHPDAAKLIDAVDHVAGDSKAPLDLKFGALQAIPTVRRILANHIARMEAAGADSARTQPFYDALGRIEKFENDYHDVVTRPDEPAAQVPGPVEEPKAPAPPPAEPPAETDQDRQNHLSEFLGEHPDEEVPTPDDPGITIEPPGTFEEKAGRLADKIEELFRSEGSGKLRSMPIDVALEKGAKIAGDIIRKGGKVADAIAAGIQHIRKNFKGAFDEKAFADKIKTALANASVPPDQLADYPLRIGTRNPTAKNATEKAHVDDTVVNIEAMRRNPEAIETARKLIKKYYPQAIKTDDPIADLVEHVKDNLVWLHDRMPEELRSRAKLWYDGARQISLDWEKKYGVSREAVAGVIASLSPQRDWFQNLSLAERVLDVVTNSPHAGIMSPKMRTVVNRWIRHTGKGKLSDGTRRMLRKALPDMINTPFHKLTTWQQAVWIRAHNSAHVSPDYRVWSPEGERMGFGLKKKGGKAKTTWGSFNQIQNAIKIIRDPSKENISKQLGKEHKVRNFFNNIVLPMDARFGDVTIDTHAVAAAVLKPLSGADREVKHNFGSGKKGELSPVGDSINGISGFYPLFADAYRKAAAERGLRPREMQSITWEAVRGLFEAEWKKKKNKKLVQNLWKDYVSGKRNLNETREQIFKAAGGITRPDWAGIRLDAGDANGNGPASHATELSGLRGDRPRERGTGRGGDSSHAIGDSRRVGQEKPPAAPVTGSLESLKADKGKGGMLDKVGAAINKRLNDINRQGRSASGLDPEQTILHAAAGAVEILKGVKDFAEWSARMTARFGKNFTPDLKKLWEDAKRIANGTHPTIGLSAHGIKTVANQDLSAQVRDAVDAHYQKLTDEGAKKIANGKIVEVGGPMPAAAKLMAGGFDAEPGKVQSAISVQVMNSLTMQQNHARAAGKTGMADQIADAQIALAGRTIQKSVNAGQTLQSYKLFYEQFTPATWLRKFRKDVGTVATDRISKATGQPVENTPTAHGRAIADKIASDLARTHPNLGDAIRKTYGKGGNGKTLAENIMASTGVDQKEAARKARKVEDFYKREVETFRKQHDIPAYDAQTERDILARANAIDKLPIDSVQRRQATTELMNWLRRSKGFSWWELPLDFWFANILSGPVTHAKNIFGNSANLAGETAIQMVRNPHAIPSIIEALGRALPKAKAEAQNFLTTGYDTATRHLGKFDQQGALATRTEKVLLPWQLVGRALKAEDVMFFYPLQEMKAAVLASRQSGLPVFGFRRAADVRRVMGWSDQARKDAATQAKNEGLAGNLATRRVNEILEQARPETLMDNAREFAFHGTFNNDVYGILGDITNAWETGARTIPAIKLIVPFTRIITNLLNSGLNWTPVGFYRSARAQGFKLLIGQESNTGKLYGKEITDPTSIGDLYARATVGSLALSALAMAAGQYVMDRNPQLMVTGSGPVDPDQRKSLAAAGWMPYSLKIGDRYYSYQSTAAAVPLALIGHYMDALRYRKLGQQDLMTRVAFAAGAFFNVTIQGAWLQGLSSIFDQANRDSVKNPMAALPGQALRTGSSFVVPNALRQIDQLFDPTKYKATDIGQMMLAQVPFARRNLQPDLNVFGQPVTAPLSKAFLSSPSNDGLTKLMAERRLWPSVPLDPYLSPEQSYALMKYRGLGLRADLLANYGDLATLPQSEAQKLVDKISRKATVEAKKDLGLDTLSGIEKTVRKFEEQ